MGLKVWCIPVNAPRPDVEPERAEAARRFLSILPGLKGLSVEKETGLMVLTFFELERARSAKWKLEEFSPVRLEIIEGTLDDAGKKIELKRVLKGE